MWTVLKFDKKNFNLFKSDLQSKIGKNFVIYKPKVLIQKYQKNKLISKEFEILGDYLFCFHKDFSDRNTINKLKFIKGLKYLLNGFTQYQKDIKNFIDNCKKIENDDGYISNNLFEINLNTLYKFSNGPFTEKIFKIVDFQKNKMNILMGNLKTTVDKREYIFNPI